MAIDDNDYIRETPIEELGLSVRSYNVLKGFVTVERLCTKISSNEQHPKCLKATDGLGDTGVAEVTAALRKMGYKFADEMQYEEWEHLLIENEALAIPNNDGITLAAHIELLHLSNISEDWILRNNIYTVGSLCELSTCRDDSNWIRKLFPEHNSLINYDQEANEIKAVVHQYGFYFSDETEATINKLKGMNKRLGKANSKRMRFLTELGEIKDQLVKKKNLTDEKKAQLVARRKIDSELMVLFSNPETRSAIERLLRKEENGRNRKFNRPS